MNDSLDNKEDINNSSRVYSLFYSFFLIPLMITIFGVLFFFLFEILTYEEQDPQHLLNNIKSGSLTKRWQSAYELSNLMKDPDKIPVSDLFTNQMISMYEKSIYDDNRVRIYLALAMGQTANPKFGSSLIKGLDDENLENRIAAIKGLGMVKFSTSVDKLNNISISDSDIQERLAAVISLGEIGDKSSEVYLLSLLEDEEPNIRWDSAIALIKMGNISGVYILEKLLKRNYYKNYSNIDENEVNNSMLTVLALVSKYPVNSFKDELEFLATKEENIKIREFSMKILSEHY
ncbi:MAG: hypothetical protein CMG14_05360 [Candidatus Marinimicrobia bacterium]|nr:hypothetical protein [Candidatus Neomarinimicrobiota bacterium]|tara:strand:+ start:13128 stop:13997 length:870 start_codon:yes stop_codon:yes gene_type:complete